MFYYKVTCTLDTEVIHENFEDRWEVSSEYKLASVEIYKKSKDTQFCFVSNIHRNSLTIGMISKVDSKIDYYLDAFIKRLAIGITNCDRKETTISGIQALLRYAENNEFISSCEEVGDCVGLGFNRYGRLLVGREFAYDDNVFEEESNQNSIEGSGCYMARSDLEAELKRISSGSKKRVTGHPVHYLLCNEVFSESKALTEVLLNSLYAYNRIKSRRYSNIILSPISDISIFSYENFYKASADSTVIVYLDYKNEKDDEFASNGMDTIKMVCSMVKKYSNDVLTILCVPKACEKTKKQLYEHLGYINLIEICDEPASADSAAEYLKLLARERNVRTDKKLFCKVEEGKSYLASELKETFDLWYSDKLKNVLFPQYRSIDSVKTKVIREEAKGCAYDELMEMIGLDRAKNVINQALDYNKAQKVFADKGMQFDRTSMHMVFTGNPGTAKTSAARLFARIMRDNEVLSRGRLIECGRGDLVGKYVGWTAKIVKDKFREAKGSVLFIDEAYSLVDNRNGMFGDEAINTIVQEMENNRDDVIVIFAGYPDKMEEFLQRNPGLKSRIAYHVPFDDYSVDELCMIADLIAEKKGLILADDAREKLRDVFGIAISDCDFGNGRYVRNVIEKAKMAQASRLLSLDYGSVSSEEVRTIVASDIEMPVQKKEKIRMGFCA
ncbi:ATPase family associated with various cellular activities (AAA) [Ruminococcaceae bacterium YRB3002]|nr:ATPase family associated with various cellular activities (AAA) [Ruminococcaceae bacterium YRB3002]